MDHRSLNCIGRMSSQQQRSEEDASDSSPSKRRPHSWHSSTQTLCRAGMYVYGAWNFSTHLTHFILKTLTTKTDSENLALAVNCNTSIVYPFLTSVRVPKKVFSKEHDLIRLLSPIKLPIVSGQPLNVIWYPQEVNFIAVVFSEAAEIRPSDGKDGCDSGLSHLLSSAFLSNPRWLTSGGPQQLSLSPVNGSGWWQRRSRLPHVLHRVPLPFRPSPAKDSSPKARIASEFYHIVVTTNSRYWREICCRSKQNSCREVWRGSIHVTVFLGFTCQAIAGGVVIHVYGVVLQK